MLNKGDVVDWTVIGAGGPKGRKLGVVRGVLTTNESHGETTFKPLDWDEAWRILKEEFDLSDFLNCIANGYLDCVQVDDCKLVAPHRANKGA